MNSIKTLLMITAGSVLFTSCIKNEYHNVTPEPVPVGYQYSFNDEFNNNVNNWEFTDPANEAYVDIINGTLKYTYLPVDPGTNTVAIATGANVKRDFLVQTRIRSDNAMGLVFGVSNKDYGYSFFIDGQGSFAVFKEGDANTPVKTIIDWTYSSTIQVNWNDIELEQIGGYWIGYINGTKVFEIESQYLSGSKFGYIVLDGTTAYADYLTVQW
jgi:hypothetical protein